MRWLPNLVAISIRPKACKAFSVIINTSIGHRNSVAVAFYHRYTTTILFDWVHSIVSMWLGR